MDPGTQRHRRQLVVKRWSEASGASTLEGVVGYLERRTLVTAPGERSALLRWLSMAGCRSSTDSFRRNLSEPECQRYAVTGLGRAGNEGDVPPLHAILSELRSPRIVRARTAQALGWLASRSSVGPLISCHEQPDRVVRKAAAKALARVAARNDGIDAMLVERSRDERVSLAHHVIEAMDYRSSEICAQRLLECVEHPTGRVRVSSAYMGLRRFVLGGGARAWPPLQRGRLMELLRDDAHLVARYLMGAKYPRVEYPDDVARVSTPPRSTDVERPP